MFKVVFGGYEYPEEYFTYDEAYEAGLEMQSAYNLGSELLLMENPGDYEEEATGSGGFKIIER
jgi:hypothetical protein